MLCFVTTAQAQSSFRIHTASVVAPHVSLLGWDEISDAAYYSLCRQYPGDAYHEVIRLSTPTFLDTLRRTICADTVNYYVAAVMPDSSVLRSDTVGLYHQDNLPTAPCALRLCSVDTLARSILLSWEPSPDTDVMGYYICTGSPCRDYDTVWGRLSTTYLCPQDVSDAAAEHSFRILAFDSCYQASPLTPYYHNPVLTLHADSCSRLLRASWNRYINMPDSVGRYRLCLRIGDSLHRFDFGSEGPFFMDTLLADPLIAEADGWLEVSNTSDTLCALSLPVRFRFTHGDTAQRLSITQLSYDASDPSITLSFDIDPDFLSDTLILYRSQADGEMEEYDRFTMGGSPDFRYTDREVSRAAISYSYRIGIYDRCGQWVKLSDTLLLTLPELADPAAYIPNVIIYGHERCGRFCPRLLALIPDGYSLDIYNRRGEHILHTSDPSACWDGTRQGIPQPQGTYTYSITCRHTDGSLRNYLGTITLIR